MGSNELNGKGGLTWFHALQLGLQLIVMIVSLVAFYFVGIAKITESMNKGLDEVGKKIEAVKDQVGDVRVEVAKQSVRLNQVETHVANDKVLEPEDIYKKK